MVKPWDDRVCCQRLATQQIQCRRPNPSDCCSESIVSIVMPWLDHGIHTVAFPVTTAVDRPVAQMDVSGP